MCLNFPFEHKFSVALTAKRSWMARVRMSPQKLHQHLHCSFPAAQTHRAVSHLCSFSSASSALLCVSLKSAATWIFVTNCVPSKSSLASLCEVGGTRLAPGDPSSGGRDTGATLAMPVQDLAPIPMLRRLRGPISPVFPCYGRI